VNAERQPPIVTIVLLLVIVLTACWLSVR